MQFEVAVTQSLHPTNSTFPFQLITSHIWECLSDRTVKEFRIFLFGQVKSRWRNMKALTRSGAALVMAGTMIFALASGPAGAASNKTQLLHAWSALENDYSHIKAAVNANNTNNAKSGFITFSRDCIPLATFETSFNATISADIFSIARLGNAWAWIGYITLTTNSSAATFGTESSRLAAAIAKFDRDLSQNGL